MDLSIIDPKGELVHLGRCLAVKPNVLCFDHPGIPIGTASGKTRDGASIFVAYNEMDACTVKRIIYASEDGSDDAWFLVKAEESYYAT